MERLYDLLHRRLAARRSAAACSRRTSRSSPARGRHDEPRPSTGGDASDARRADARASPPGLASPLVVVLVLYGGLALTVDFPRAALGIQSDEATYYMMGHSLAAGWRPDLPPRGPRARLARVPDRARRASS